MKINNLTNLPNEGGSGELYRHMLYAYTVGEKKSISVTIYNTSSEKINSMLSFLQCYNTNETTQLQGNFIYIDSNNVAHSSIGCFFTFILSDPTSYNVTFYSWETGSFVVLESKVVFSTFDDRVTKIL